MGLIFDADVPIPAKPHGGGKKLGPTSPMGRFAVALMDQPIGASAVAPSNKPPGTISGILNGYGGKGWYTCRRTPEGVRVWKIAEPTKKRNG